MELKSNFLRFFAPTAFVLSFMCGLSGFVDYMNIFPNNTGLVVAMIISIFSLSIYLVVSGKNSGVGRIITFSTLYLLSLTFVSLSSSLFQWFSTIAFGLLLQFFYYKMNLRESSFSADNIAMLVVFFALTICTWVAVFFMNLRRKNTNWEAVLNANTIAFLIATLCSFLVQFSVIDFTKYLKLR